MTQTVDLTRSFVELASDGSMQPVELTPSFWRDSSQSAHYDRLVGVFEFESADDLHAAEQEMHPEADELIVLLAGAIDVIAEEPAGERRLALEAGGAAIVPRGVWHRLVMRKPGKLLFINCRTGMQSRKA